MRENRKGEEKGELGVEKEGEGDEGVGVYCKRNQLITIISYSLHLERSAPVVF